MRTLIVGEASSASEQETGQGSRASVMHRCDMAALKELVFKLTIVAVDLYVELLSRHPEQRCSECNG
jgi:hypothetical protein